MTKKIKLSVEDLKELNELGDREHSIAATLQQAMDYHSRTVHIIHESRIAFWRRILKEFNLDPSKEWQANRETGLVEIVAGKEDGLKFKEWDCAIQYTRYPHNGQAAIHLLALEDGTPVATATVCLNYPFEQHQTAIKSWSENEGMLKVLTDAGLVQDTGVRIEAGYVEAALVELINPPGY